MIQSLNSIITWATNFKPIAESLESELSGSSATPEEIDCQITFLAVLTSKISSIQQDLAAHKDKLQSQIEANKKAEAEILDDEKLETFSVQSEDSKFSDLGKTSPPRDDDIPPLEDDLIQTEISHEKETKLETGKEEKNEEKDQLDSHENISLRVDLEQQVLELTKKLNEAVLEGDRLRTSNEVLRTQNQLLIRDSSDLKNRIKQLESKMIKRDFKKKKAPG